MKELAPVFAAIAGGLLTALGTLLIQRTARAAEQRKFLREQLERLYALSSQLIRWAHRQVDTAAILGLAMSGSAGAAAESIASQENIAQPTDDILLLSRFYHPRLSKDAEDLEATAARVVDCVNEFSSYIAGKPFSDEVDPARLHPASEARDELVVRVRQFQQVLAAEARKLV